MPRVRVLNLRLYFCSGKPLRQLAGGGGRIAVAHLYIYTFGVARGNNIVTAVFLHWPLSVPGLKGHTQEKTQAHAQPHVNIAFLLSHRCIGDRYWECAVRRAPPSPMRHSKRDIRIRQMLLEGWQHRVIALLRKPNDDSRSIREVTAELLRSGLTRIRTEADPTIRVLCAVCLFLLCHSLLRPLCFYAFLFSCSNQISNNHCYHICKKSTRANA